jgi:hypothetical protein
VERVQQRTGGMSIFVVVVVRLATHNFDYRQELSHLFVMNYGQPKSEIVADIIRTMLLTMCCFSIRDAGRKCGNHTWLFVPHAGC